MKKAILFILDGWGINPNPDESAIERARTPYFDNLMQSHPNATLITHGEDVGLPDGQMGNSEVGHMNIGAGRVIYQELARINKAVKDGELDNNEILLDTISVSTGTIHLMGLVSDGGVHSHINHLLALAKICRKHYTGRICIHAFTDGRDVDPKSGKGFLERVLEVTKPLDIAVASVVGRYYAMDRDRRWERTKLAYDLLVHGKGIPTKNIVKSIQESYDENITDEFIRPYVLVDELEKPVSQVKNGDTVLFFNFRTDRPRQLTEALSQSTIEDHEMTPLDITMMTMTQYDSDFNNIRTLFPETEITGTLGEYLSAQGKTQLRVAETEKYPHVSYFFSGGNENLFEGEDRLLIPSPKVATYDLQPEMSAHEVTTRTIEYIQKHTPDFICLNYANTDMVGHTGVFAAAVKAAETVDQCLSEIIPVCLDHGYAVFIIADHGNADTMVNPDGSPHTAHTKNPVPVLYVSSDSNDYKVMNGRLADIAPSILSAMGLPIPSSMDGMILQIKDEST